MKTIRIPIYMLSSSQDDIVSAVYVENYLESYGYQNVFVFIREGNFELSVSILDSTVIGTLFQNIEEILSSMEPKFTTNQLN